MRITAIQGELITLGESEFKNGARIYDYLSFVGPTGQQTVVRKARVSQDVDRLLAPGAEGVFLVGKTVFETGVYAAKVNGLDAAIEWLTGGNAKPTAAYIVLIVLGLILTATVIGAILGIPFLILGIWGLVSFPGWKRRLEEGARNAGISLQRVRSI